MVPDTGGPGFRRVVQMTDENDKSLGGDLRSFGRKRGRKPSPRQEALLTDRLPHVRVDLKRLPERALNALFQPEVREVWLEIGFGGAEHMVHQARCNPDVGLIGCEPFEDGVIKALSAMETFGLSNIQIHPDDARPLLRALPAASIARVFVLFPDPWPKARHAKRRLVSPGLLEEFARVLTDGGELRIATDIPAYVRTVMEAAAGQNDLAWTARAPGHWRTPWADWPGTRYEAKALREGRTPVYLTFIRRLRPPQLHPSSKNMR